MSVIGDRRLTKRVRFRDGVSIASWHIRFTRATGSTGASVLKNTTAMEFRQCLILHLRESHVQTTLHIDPHVAEKLD